MRLADVFEVLGAFAAVGAGDARDTVMSCQSMRIAWTSVLCLAAGCFADRLTGPMAEALPVTAPAHVHVDEAHPIRSSYELVLGGVVYRFPQDSARFFNQLDPADIENIEVIKGPRASALYGRIGCSAVVIVTTKKPRSGATQ